MLRHTTRNKRKGKRYKKKAKKRKEKEKKRGGKRKKERHLFMKWKVIRIRHCWRC